MFLPLLQRRNPDLLRTAVRLQREGRIPANCYVIDLDAVERNARAIAAEADRLGLLAFAMTKQIGRNPDASAAILRGGISRAVGVDLECAIAARVGGLATGHLGHLVQIPRHRADEAARLEPDFWTVFSLEKAAEAGAAARRRGRIQNVLVRIFASSDRFYPGHEGGLPAEDIVEVARRIDALEGVRFAGVTTFPAMLFDRATGSVRPTPNLSTLTRAQRRLQDAGFTDVELNAPGTTSSATLQSVADAGATQVEPGHGLTGTTPLHAVEDLVEDPAIVYVSEVSHLWNGSAYVFGGGLYPDPVLSGVATDALVVGDDEDAATARRLPVDMPASDAIDYYARIPDAPSTVSAGDTVVFGFRPQVFVTRALTIGIRGLSTGRPEPTGVWAANGARALGVDDAVDAARRMA